MIQGVCSKLGLNGYLRWGWASCRATLAGNLILKTGRRSAMISSAAVMAAAGAV
jgi:hypothetical protein